MFTHLSALHHLLPASPFLLELLPLLRLNYLYKVRYISPASILNTNTRPASHIFFKKKKKTFSKAKTVDCSFVSTYES